MSHYRLARKSYRVGIRRVGNSVMRQNSCAEYGRLTVQTAAGTGSSRGGQLFKVWGAGTCTKGCELRTKVCASWQAGQLIEESSKNNSRIISKVSHTKGGCRGPVLWYSTCLIVWPG